MARNGFRPSTVSGICFTSDGSLRIQRKVGTIWHGCRHVLGIWVIRIVDPSLGGFKGKQPILRFPHFEILYTHMLLRCLVAGPYARWVVKERSRFLTSVKFGWKRSTSTTPVALLAPAFVFLGAYGMGSPCGIPGGIPGEIPGVLPPWYLREGSHFLGYMKQFVSRSKGTSPETSKLGKLG